MKKQFHFIKDIEEFLNQDQVLQSEFNIFKLKYCLGYKLKDKKQLLVVLDKIQAGFKNGVYKGSLNISNILLDEPKLKKVSIINKRKELKHSQEYYRLKKLKHAFPASGTTLEDIANYFHYDKNRLLREMRVPFNSITLLNVVSENHLKFISQNLYYQLQEIKKDRETIITKTPKTKPNYFKIIYTK